MKRALMIAIALGCVTSAFAQGLVNLNTKVYVAGNPNPGGDVWAPVFLANPTDPTRQQFGQSTAVNLGGAFGTTAYGGGYVIGAGYTAELWGGAAGSAENQLVLVAKTTFRTQTTTAVGGTLNPVNPSPAVPDVAAGQKATFQLRVYQNNGGAVNSWDAALLAAAANPTFQFGASKLFTPSLALGSATAQIPNLQGLESFSLQVVPEPSVIALGVLGVGALVLFRRRK